MNLDAGSIVIAAMGGAVGRVFGERGLNWVLEKFKNHTPEAQVTAAKNLESACSILADKLARLTERSDYNEALLERAMADPAVGTLLQQALNGAAQTSVPEKHDLLGRLIIDRLTAEPESIIALATPKACEAILYLTVPQIKILAFSATAMFASPLVSQMQGISRAAYLGKLREWFEPRFFPFVGMETNNNDFMHLDALSCGAIMVKNVMPIETLLEKTMSQPDNLVGTDDLLPFKGGNDFIRIWNEQLLRNFMPTSIGKLVGLLASDAMSNQATDMSNFGGDEKFSAAESASLVW